MTALTHMSQNASMVTDLTMHASAKNPLCAISSVKDPQNSTLFFVSVLICQCANLAAPVTCNTPGLVSANLTTPLNLSAIVVSLSLIALALVRMNQVM